MATIEILCGPDEFWDKIRSTVRELGLVCFRQYQRDGRIVPLTLEEISQPLEWQWDIWCAKELPKTEYCQILPAVAGWILIRGPKLGPDNRIIEPWIAARIDWFDREEKATRKNDDLRKLFARFRRQFCKNSMVGEGTIVLGPENHYTRRFRYTREALRLQNDGWTFVDNIPGAIYQIPSNLPEP